MVLETLPQTITRTAAGAELETLRFRLDGELITADDATYDEARKVVSIEVNRRPRAIVRAAHAGDVAEAVRFAKAQGLPLTVRSGGHSLAFFSVVDGGLTVDLSRMKRVRIDPVAQIARVQGGATSGDLAAPANEHELALTTGDTRSVGLGGLTTGGGVGFMVRKYGLTIDSLISAQVVTASGDIVTASETSHPDLFWAIRGGGGNFGIVTEFTFHLAPVGQILGGSLMLPATREVIRAYLEYSAAAPEDLTTIANVQYAPPAPFVPADKVGTLVLNILICWSGGIEEGQRALAPLRALAEPVAEAIFPMPYPDIYKFTDHQSLPHGASIRQMFADELSDATIDASLEAMQRSTSPYSLIHLRGLGGAMAEVAPEATAFAHRTQRYFYSIIGLWLDPAEDARVHKAWTETLWNAVQTDGSGVYVNFLENEGDARVREAYPAATYARLAAVKAAYDPDNLFRFNQNITPRA